MAAQNENNNTNTENNNTTTKNTERTTENKERKGVVRRVAGWVHSNNALVGGIVTGLCMCAAGYASCEYKHRRAEKAAADENAE